MGKLVRAMLLAGLILAGLGWWSYRQDKGEFDARREEAARGCIIEISRLREAAEGSRSRMAATRVEIAAQALRAEQAGKVARQLEELSSGLNRLTTGAAQLTENRERLARMQQMEKDARSRAIALEQDLVRIQWEKDGIEIALARKQQELAAARSDRSVVLHYARITWLKHGWWVSAAAGILVLAPVLLRRR